MKWRAAAMAQRAKRPLEAAEHEQEATQLLALPHDDTKDSDGPPPQAHDLDPPRGRCGVNTMPTRCHAYAAALAWGRHVFLDEGSEIHVCASTCKTRWHKKRGDVPA